MNKIDNVINAIIVLGWQLAGKEKGVPLTHADLYQLASEIFSREGLGTDYDRTYLWDALQVASFMRTLSSRQVMPQTQAQAQEYFDYLLQEHVLDPTHTARTEEQMAFQQFSTPPHYAWLATWLAHLQPGDWVLEPSAGLGGLFKFTLSEYPVVANEGEPRRHALLQRLAQFNANCETATLRVLPAVDAASLYALEPGVRPPVVLMNPPFASNGLTGAKDPMIAALHIERALAQLADNGRLVAIAPGGLPAYGPGGMGMDAPAYKAWWKRIRATYCVRANFCVSGDTYKKHGTTIQTRLLVIDKTGPTVEEPLQGQGVVSLDAIWEHAPALRQLRGQKPAVLLPRAAVVIDQQQALQAIHASFPQADEEALLAEIEAARAELETPPWEVETPGTGDPVFEITVDTLPSCHEPTPETTPPVAAEAPSVDVADHAGPDVVQDPAPAVPLLCEPKCPAAATAETGRPDKTDSTGPVPVLDTPVDEDEGIFRGYKPFLQLSEAKAHPAPLVESEAMRMVEPPIPRAKIKLPAEAVLTGRISAAQIERVMYAVHSTNQRLEGEDAGYKSFLIGDGTGFGKGTTLAAIGMHFKLSGAKRILWLSKSSDLIADARRDWEWVGGEKDDVFSLDNQKNPVVTRHGIMFSTYTMLARRQAGTEQTQTSGWDVDATGAIQGRRSKVKLKGVDRYEQIRQWLEEAGEHAVILMDEAHEMGNAISQRGKRGSKKASKKALAGIDLQRALPKAKIIFASATAATEVHNLAYAAERLGLCGPQVPAFPDLETFITKVAAGGMLVMEMVAKDMKALGVYQATNLSYAGTTFGLLEHQLTEDQITMYDSACEAWRIVMEGMEEAMRVNGSEDNADVNKYVKGQYYGAMQRFFNQLLTSMQTPTAISDMEKELEAGHSVVIQLVNTNEAATERAVTTALQQEQDLDDLDITPRDTLMNVVKQVFPIVLYEQYADDEGNMRTRAVVDANGDMVVNPVAEQMREALLLKIACIRVPQGALDMILDHFGATAVAEVTGRSARYILEKGHRIREVRSKGKCNAEVLDFNEGERRILVFSGAGNTGRSFHSDKRFKNQQRRIHYVLQAGWRADEALQGLGRTHRTNEANAPEYKLVTTDLKGQKRFITSIARRIEQLGSLTKGDRKAASGGLFSEDDNLETDYAAGAIWVFFSSLFEGKLSSLEIRQRGKLVKTGLSFEQVTREMGLSNLLNDAGALNREAMPPITKFLNRLLCLSCAIQDTVFTQWFEMMQALIDQAREQGTFDMGVEKIHGERIRKMREVPVHRDRGTNAVTKVVELLVTKKIHVCTWEMVNGGQYITPSKVGYAQTDAPLEGFYRNKSTGRVYAYFKAGFATVHKTGEVVESIRRVYPTGYMRYNAPELHQLGDVSVDRETAMALWNDEVARQSEYNEETVYLLTGAILPVWEKVVTYEMRIQQAETEEGERLIGCVIAPERFADTMRNLGAVHDGVYRTPEQLFHAVLHQKASLHLANGYRIRNARAGGRELITVTGDMKFSEIEALKNMGLVRQEFVANRIMVFIPFNDLEDSSRFAKLLESRPAVEMVMGGVATPLLLSPPVEKTEEVIEEAALLGHYPIDELVELCPLPTDNRQQSLSDAPQAEDVAVSAQVISVPPVKTVTVALPPVLHPKPQDAQHRLQEMMTKAKELGKKVDKKHYEREASGQMSLF